MKRFLTVLSVLCAAALLPASADAGNGTAPAGKTAKTGRRFWEARRVMLSGDPATAAELFRTFAKESPESPRAPDALYWQGRCDMRQSDREPDAVVAFLRVIRDYGKSPFVADAARELAILGDRSAVPLLTHRARGTGTAAEEAARALAAIRDHAPAARSTKDDEIAALQAQVVELRRELDGEIQIVKTLLAERKREKGAAKERPSTGKGSKR